MGISYLCGVLVWGRGAVLIPRTILLSLPSHPTAVPIQVGVETLGLVTMALNRNASSGNGGKVTVDPPSKRFL
jgi:hypothetical protein